MIENGKQKLIRYEDNSEMTEKSLSKLAKECSAIKINGIDDKAGYKLAKEKRAFVVKQRTKLEARRKGLVENAIKFQRDINAEAKKYTEILRSIEDPLDSEIKRIDEMKEAEKKAAELAKEKSANERINKLIDEGLQFTGEYYTIGDISISVVDVRSMSEETFNTLFEKVKETADKIKKAQEEAQQAAQLEKLRHSRSMELLKSGFNFNPETSCYLVGDHSTVNESNLAEITEDEYIQLLESGKNEIKRIADEAAARKHAEEAEAKRKADELAEAQRKIDEDNRRLESEKQALIKQKEDARIKQVANLGLIYNGESFVYKDENISMIEIKTLSDQDFNMVLSQVGGRLAELKEEQRLADEKAEQDRKDAAAAQAKSDQEAREAKAAKEKADREAAEQLKKDQAPDIEKINLFYHKVTDTINDFPDIKDESIRLEFYGQIERILNFVNIQKRSNIGIK